VEFPVSETILASEHGLGQSNDVPTTVSYQTFYNQLAATNANPAAIAGLE
jgi:hypothetical protein